MSTSTLAAPTRDQVEMIVRSIIQKQLANGLGSNGRRDAPPLDRKSS